MTTTETKPAYPTRSQIRERLASVEQEYRDASARLPGEKRRLAMHNLTGARGTYDEAEKLHSHLVVLEIEIEGLRLLEIQAEYRELKEANASDERDIPILRHQLGYRSDAMEKTGKTEYELQHDLTLKERVLEARQKRLAEIQNTFSEAIKEIDPA